MRKLVYIPYEGEIRIIRVFLWSPRQIGGDWRWLEWARIQQHSGFCVTWIDDKFLD